ncbi:MAG: acyloxyacyl hydrolase [Bacteroidota bacterium]
MANVRKLNNLKWLTIILATLLFLPLSSSGQHAIGLDLAYGRILKIHPDFPEIKHNAYQFSGSYLHYTTGKKRTWPKLYKFPIVGLNLTYESFGNAESLGKAISLTPSMGFYLLKKKRTDLIFTWGMGIGWLTKPYDKISNPDNIVIGSRLNFSAFAKIHLEWAASYKIRIAGGIQYMHYSNGNHSTPNIGANIPAGFLGVRYFYQESEVERSLTDSTFTLPVPNRKIHFNTRLSIGFTERGLDGPTFPVYTFSVGAYRYFGRKHKVLTGFEFVFHHGTAEFIRHIEGFEGEEFRQSSRYSWYIGHEAVFGHVGFLTEAGLYLNNFFLRRSLISNRIGFTFYGKNPLKVYRNLPYVGIYIHAVQGEAEFTEFLIGFDF